MFGFQKVSGKCNFCDTELGAPKRVEQHLKSDGSEIHAVHKRCLRAHLIQELSSGR